MIRLNNNYIRGYFGELQGKSGHFNIAIQAKHFFLGGIFSSFDPGQIAPWHLMMLPKGWKWNPTEHTVGCVVSSAYGDTMRRSAL